jgi:hypothetical protein
LSSRQWALNSENSDWAQEESAISTLKAAGLIETDDPTLDGHLSKANREAGEVVGDLVFWSQSESIAQQSDISAKAYCSTKNLLEQEGVAAQTLSERQRFDMSVCSP